MWIRTQDQKELVQVIRCSLSKVLMEKKCFIFGHYAGTGFWSENKITLGEYTSYERAIEELEAIQNHLSANTQAVYRMSPQS